MEADMKAIVIVEAISTGLFYEQDILDRGYQPLVIYPYIEGKEEDKAYYENARSACRKQLSDRTIVIPDDGCFEHLLTALKPYDIACVLAGSEMGVVLADRLAQALSLPGNPPSSSQLHLNKDLMQEALRSHGLRSIRGRVVHSVQEVRDYWKELGVPHVVIKQVAGAATMGLHFCNSLEEAEKAAEEELKNSDYFGKRGDGLIMQERIEGTEYIVNTVSRNGVHRVTDIWVYDKVRRGQSGNAYNYARILRRLEAGHAEMVEYAYRVLDALDFRYGPSHGEYMLTETGPVLIEVGARPMGGHFMRSMLDRLLGHHLTDASLDSYLDPDAFERDRKKKYRTNGFLMNKFFITPEGGAVDSYPVLTLLHSLKTYAGGSLSPAFADFQLPKTVDLDSAPGNILLYSEDENEVWRDYQLIRTIETRCFSALFQMNGKMEHYPRTLPSVPSPAGRQGSIRILADEKNTSDGAQWLTPDELSTAAAQADTGIFLMQGKYSLEERVSLLHSLICSIRPGGCIEIPKEIYAPSSIGRTGFELLLEAFGVTLEVPACGTDESIIGTIEEKA